MHNKDLKRCPFCGHKGKFRQDLIGVPLARVFRIDCDNVSCEVTTPQFGSRKLAFLCWQKRTS